MWGVCCLIETSAKIDKLTNDGGQRDDTYTWPDKNERPTEIADSHDLVCL